ncbi:glycosyltransferase family 52 protein [Photobacterium sp. ZSDE20]|uniref:Glycosyltransferase family 52 protein n=1 Tax=Photobacterium pectinilyticum TaxID=2906793 RepID=A0ABT1MXZ0_9GAMM|nr:glycosyltransferase family 52 [Photobacterium sp. ZSDE20]MCQ1057244.1 glycosyltransferase family 52 protein [Photobacterium sp. ZSDE20]MDD1821702.1 glycosyltransferase family 52 protein [Photobacterium sp. ZSDE20]
MSFLPAKKKIVFENTYFSLFIYVLLDDDWQNSDYIFWGNRFTLNCVKRMANTVNVLACSYHYLPRVIPKLNKAPIRYFKRKIEQKQIFRSYDICVGNAREINNPLINIDRVQIDDGVGTTHVELANGPKNKSVLNRFLSRLVLKEATKISKIGKFYLSQDIEVKAEFKEKIEVLDLNALWAEKTEEQRAQILELFDVDANEFECFDNSYSVLFTQPLNEVISGYSEQSKVDGYKTLLKNLDIDESKLIIKPHPADQTDYTVHFPHASVLRPSFPAEIMSLLGMEADKVITLTSTAVELFRHSSREVIYAKAPDYFKLPEKRAKAFNALNFKK